MFHVGEKVNVMLPWWVQCSDDVEPFVQATVLSAGDETVRIEYDTPYGRRDLVIHEFNRISKIEKVS